MKNESNQVVCPLNIDRTCVPSDSWTSARLVDLIQKKLDYALLHQGYPCYGCFH